MAVITFYTSCEDQTGNTTSALALATYLGIVQNKKILYISTAFNDNTIRNAMWEKKAIRRSGLFGPNTTDDAMNDNGIEGLDRIGIQHTVPQGAYYILLDISEFGYSSDLDFCERLAEYVGVGAVPGSSFFKEPENRYIRLHYAKKNETLENALGRLNDIRKKMPKE